MKDMTQQLTEKVVRNSLELGILMVREIATGAIKKNANISLRDFLKVLAKYEQTQAVHNNIS